MKSLKYPAFLLAFLFFCLQIPCVFAEPNKVKVAHQGQNYALFLNGKPFYIQGAGAGLAFGARGENYLKMAKELGANTVRSWGCDQGNQQYLDEAQRLGLYVVAGIWLDYPDEEKRIGYLAGRGYQAYMNEKEKEVLDYVTRYKDHPAVLVWGLGNEVIHFTKSEAERVAFAKFLERLIQKVHSVDPTHPVVYASAGRTGLPYLKKYTPSLDIIGVNDYGDVQFIENLWMDLGFDAPYLMTEFGALGPWDIPKDANGKCAEHSDYSKAAQVRNYWNRIREKRGNNIGGCVFHLGETTQETLTYYNINDHEYRREAYLLIQSLYTGQKVVHHAPRIKAFNGVPAMTAKGVEFNVEIKTENAQGNSLTYTYKASTAIEGVLQYYVNEEVPIHVKGAGNKVTITAPEKEGVYRIYGFVRDEYGNVSSANSTLHVV